MNSITRLLSAASVVSLIWLSSCSTDDPALIKDPYTYEDFLPITEIIWASPGEFMFVVGDKVKKYNVETNAVDVIATNFPAGSQIWFNDGGLIYTVAFGDLSGGSFSLSLKSVDLATQEKRTHLEGIGMLYLNRPVVASKDLVACRISNNVPDDSFFVHRIGEPQVRSSVLGRPFRFSPDDHYLLYSDLNEELKVLDVKASEAIPLSGEVKAAFSGAAGLQFGVDRFNRTIGLKDVFTKEVLVSKPIEQLGRIVVFGVDPPGALSTSGTQFVYVSERCIPENSTECKESEFDIHWYDRITDSDVIILNGVTELGSMSGTFSNFSISPDEQRVAFSHDSKLYVVQKNP